jgi:tetratricopeptide (TPR) repeat protein
MAKPMVVTLPFVLLLIDLWPLGRPKTLALLREKVPFFALSLISAAITYWTQAASGATDALPVAVTLRLENACVSYVAYLGELVWPSGLAVFYPYPHAIPAWQWMGAAALIAAISYAALRTTSYFAVGWLWYLGTLVPVIGLVQVGAQARADRYTYLPYTGLFIIAAWGVNDAAKRWPWAKASAPVVVAACLLLTAQQVQYWRDSEALFRRAIAVTDGNDLAEHNLGSFLMTIPGRSGEAAQHLQASLRIRPGSAKAHTDLGTVYSAQPDRLEDAVREYRAALNIAPGLAPTHNNLGNTLAKLNRLNEAIAEYRAALAIDASYAEAHNGLGAALASTGHPAEARREFQEALRLRPDDAEARRNLTSLDAPADTAEAEYTRAMALARAGNREAASHFEAALRLKPDYAEAHNNLGVVLSAIPGRSQEAIGHFQQAIGIRPNYAEAHVNLGIALAQMGRTQDAVRELETAEGIQPDPEVHKMLKQLGGK